MRYGHRAKRDSTQRLGGGPQSWRCHVYAPQVLGCVTEGIPPDVIKKIFSHTVLKMNKYGKRQRSYRRKAYRSKRKNTRLVKKIKSIARSVASKQFEVKKYIIGGVEAALSTLTQGTNWIQCGVNIAQGVSSFERVGTRIRILAIQTKIFLHNNADVPLYARYCLIRPTDRAALGSTSKIFCGSNNQDSDFATETGMKCIMRTFSKNTVEKVYKNKLIKMDGNGDSGDSYFVSRTLFQKFGRGIVVDYNVNNMGVTNMNPNIQFGIWVAEAAEDVGAGTTVEWTHQTTVFYTDA